MSGRFFLPLKAKISTHPLRLVWYYLQWQSFVVFMYYIFSTKRCLRCVRVSDLKRRRGDCWVASFVAELDGEWTGGLEEGWPEPLQTASINASAVPRSLYQWLLWFRQGYAQNFSVLFSRRGCTEVNYGILGDASPLRMLVPFRGTLIFVDRHRHVFIVEPVSAANPNINETHKHTHAFFRFQPHRD